MSRSGSLRAWKRVLAAARVVEETGWSAKEAVQRLREAARRQVRAAPTRRSVVKGIGAAGLVTSVVGCGVGQPRSAIGAPLKKKATTAPRIAIVGGGMAGLACADTLAAKGVASTVYEAGSRVGGRMSSVGGAFGGINLNGQVAELGGEFIDTSHATMKAYANALDLDLEDVNKVDGDVFFVVDGVQYSEDEVVDEFSVLADAMKDDLRDLGEPLPGDFTPFDEELDYTSMEEYLVTRSAPPLIADILRETYRNEYGLDVSKLSSLNFLFLAKASSSSLWRPYGVFSDERYHVIGGNQQIPEGIAESLGSSVVYEHRLEALSRTSSGVYQLTFDHGGTSVTVEADYVVIALPFSVLRTLDLDDASLGLPAEKRLVIDTLQYGTNSKIITAFDGRPWADFGGNGSIVAFGFENLNSTWETNPSVATDTSAAFVDFSSDARGAGLDESDPSGEAEAMLADLDVVWPGASAFARRDGGGAVVAQVKNWSQDPNNLGAYTANQPGYFTTLADFEGTRVDKLLFAGEHCDSFYAFQGWMEGAANSGIAAADAILAEI